MLFSTKMTVFMLSVAISANDFQKMFHLTLCGIYHGNGFVGVQLTPGTWTEVLDTSQKGRYIPIIKTQILQAFHDYMMFVYMKFKWTHVSVLM